MNWKEFYKGKKVFVTGHTGFKGTWLCEMLLMAGAKLYGYSLEPETDPSLFSLTNMQGKMHSIIGDVRDLEHLQAVFQEIQPEIVFHLAAQPIVRESYKNPVYTYETNVMGTVHIMECIRMCPSVKSVINITTDKVYMNHESDYAYVETDELNGYDPYSNSKSCSELVTSSYINSFFMKEDSPAISTMRAGNVIGGGDFAVDRIIPDCVRAALDKKPIIIRNPNSIRPYQHVLEPLYAYLTVAMKQYENKKYAGSYNVGPRKTDCLTTGELSEIFVEEWENYSKEKVEIIHQNDNGPHEANYLKLNCTKLFEVIGLQPRYDAREAIRMVVEWTTAYKEKKDICACMREQIEKYCTE